MGTPTQRLRIGAWAVTAVAALAGVACATSRHVVSGLSAGGLSYEIRGTGEPVVFVHAFSVDGRMWDPQLVAFERDFKVIRYDLRGHGRSAAPDEPYTGFGDLRALLDELDVERATLVGLSAGSEVAINFAIAYPDRVSRLVLAAPGLGGYTTPPLPWLQPVFEAAGAGDSQRAARLWAETPIMALHTNRDAAEAVTSLVMENWRLWTYRRTEQPLSPPAIGRLEEITCPVLVIVGDRDLPHILDIARLIEANVEKAIKVIIPGAGHLVNLDAPAAFNEAAAAFVKEPQA
jgi:3-oxoadipate enol-lactonase